MPEITKEITFRREYESEKVTIVKPCANGCKIEYPDWYKFCPICGEVVKYTTAEKYSPDADKVE